MPKKRDVKGSKPLVWLALAGLVFVVGVTLIDLIGVDRLRRLTPQDWAAWVQAIGSVIAIVAAALIGNRQIAAATELEISRRKSDELNRLFIVLVLVESIQVNAFELFNSLESETSGADVDADTLAHLDHAAAALAAVDPFTLPAGKLVGRLRPLAAKAAETVNAWRMAQHVRGIGAVNADEVTDLVPPLLAALVEDAERTVRLCKLALSLTAPLALHREQ